MPVIPLAWRPGVDTQKTPKANASSFVLSNLIRWKNDLLEKLGGWLQLFPAPCAGFVRSMHVYEDLQGAKTLLLGTDGGAQLYISGSNTPVALKATRRVADIATSPLSGYTTASGSPTCTITDPGHGATSGDIITIVNTTWFGGVLMRAGSTRVISVLNPNQYSFSLPSVATANVVAGSTNAIGSTSQFTLSAGSSIVNVHLRGHGLSVGSTYVVQIRSNYTNGLSTMTLYGAYVVLSVIDVNHFTFDSGQTLADASLAPEFGENSIVIVGTQSPGRIRISYADDAAEKAVNWFTDNFGQYGLIAYEGSPIYVYTPPASSPATMSVIASGPQINAGIFVAMPQAQIISFGSEATLGGGVQDPLLVRWCAPGDFDTWVASATNQAGSFRLSRGSRLIAGLQSAQSTLLWTDTDLWSMQYIGGTLVYSFSIMGSGCGIIAPKARTVVGRSTYWASINAFWMFGDGGVQPVECPVWDYVFGDMDRENQYKCWMWANSSFHEATFFFPSASGGTGEIDSYAKVNVVSGLWDVGRLVRTAGIDNSLIGSPLAADGEYMIQQHEMGYDANGEAMQGVYAKTGFLEIAAGQNSMFVDQFLPDFKWLGENGSVNVTLFWADYTGGPVTTDGPYSFTRDTLAIPLRVRARYVAFRFDWEDQEGFSARIGLPSLRAAPNGRPSL